MKKVIYVTVTILVMLTYGIAFAASGKINCGGTTAISTLASGNQVVQRVIYTVRNFSHTTSQTINRIVVYDQDGVVRCDFGKIESFTPITLLPHQSFSFDTNAMSACQNPVVPTPPPGTILQVVIYWSSPVAGKLTAVYTSTGTNTTTEEITKFALRCDP